jgi:ribosomal protein S14
MFFANFKDKKNRIAYANAESRFKINKFLFINLLSKNKKNSNFCIKSEVLGKTLNLLKKKSKKTRILRRSIFDNNKKVFSRIFGFSRHSFKNLLKLGLVPGYKKAIW